MLIFLYCLFIVVSCTSHLWSPVGWIIHRLCEQYRYWLWRRKGNIIIIVPEPSPALSLSHTLSSVARSADFPASVEDFCCNFFSVRAVNNILCRAASLRHWCAQCCYLRLSGSHHPPIAHGKEKGERATAQTENKWGRLTWLTWLSHRNALFHRTLSLGNH